MEPFRAQSFHAVLVGSRSLAPNVRELRFEREDGHALQFSPGQWLNLFLPLPDREVKRAYSIASAPDACSPCFELAVTRVDGGPGSTFLNGLPLGARLRMMGPHGVFIRDPALPHPSLFVGTGTGVAPLRSMLRASLADAGAGRLWVLFGARCEADILYREEFEAAARRSPRVRYEVTLSRPGPSWTGRTGYVQTHLAEIVDELTVAAGGGPIEAYVCGLDRMVSAAKHILRTELGMDRHRVHAEKYD